ncbi:hypothetical protein HYFRA_00006908 [Hymenoscyphus fraxineus]|uniref:Mid2 domain-containing protein n=1 Tax=Hymenoscyphus fraxineus TaxID=746836 RepID=A0A9N9KQS2_9HELO|nr:hypothetical protein HYFRA_00006908 [Hymenoscyphus fraxineus]
MSSMVLRGFDLTISNVEPAVSGSGVVSTTLPLETLPVKASGGGRGELRGLREKDRIKEDPECFGDIPGTAQITTVLRRELNFELIATSSTIFVVPVKSQRIETLSLTTTIHETLTATGISNTALSSMQQQGPARTLEAAERPTSLPSNSSSSISRETKVGIGVGVSLGFLILVSIIIFAFRFGRKTGMSSAAAKRTGGFQGSWFRRSGFGKAELCAESQQIFEIGSGKLEVKVGELEANTKVVELEGD